MLGVTFLNPAFSSFLKRKQMFPRPYQFFIKMGKIYCYSSWNTNTENALYLYYMNISAAVLKL